jgi:chemotaxis protein MotA
MAAAPRAPPPRAQETDVDIATLFGLVVGAVIVAVAVLVLSDGDVTPYFDATSILIVLGGSVTAMIASVPITRVLRLPAVIAKAFMARPVEPMELVRLIVDLAEVARRDGILALENMILEMDDPFLVRGIQMAVDGTDPEIIQTILETELDNLLERHEAGKNMLDLMGRYCPAFGMIGTLVGLVAMLRSMDDPSRIGVGMATALLTTFYGAFLANVVFLPLADKLAARTAEEALAKTVIIHGVMAIQSGDNPRTVESKLMTFIPPGQRLREAA